MLVISQWRSPHGGHTEGILMGRGTGHGPTWTLLSPHQLTRVITSKLHLPRFSHKCILSVAPVIISTADIYCFLSLHCLCLVCGFSDACVDA